MKKLSYSILTCAVAFSLFTGSGEVEAQTFSDIPKDYTYYNQIEQLAELGIITKNEKFNPESELTRGQMAKMIALALKLDTTNVKDPQFKDVPKSHQFYPYIAALVNKGIVNGYSDKTFGVGNKVKHSHLAKFLVNGFDLDSAEKEYFNIDGQKKGSEIYTNFATLDFYNIFPNTVYNPNSNVLRYEAAAMIANTFNLEHEKIVRVPASQIPMLRDTYGSYIDFETSNNSLIIKVDAATDELVLIPQQPGKVGIYFYFREDRPILQVDIDEDLTVHYEPVQTFDREYKINREHYIDSTSEKLITDITVETLTGEKEIGHSSAKDENLEYYEQVYLSTDRAGDLLKATLNYTNGQTEEFFFSAVEDSIEVLLYPLYVGDANSVQIVDYSYEIPTLTSGNAIAVHIEPQVNEYSDELYTKYLEFSEPGTYLFTTNDGSTLQVNVYEVEGKLMSNFLYID